MAAIANSRDEGRDCRMYYTGRVDLLSLVIARRTPPECLFASTDNVLGARLTTICVNQAIRPRAVISKTAEAVSSQNHLSPISVPSEARDVILIVFSAL